MQVCSFCDFSATFKYISLLLPMFNRNRLYHFFLLKKVKTRNTQMIITNKNMKKIIMNRTYKQGHNYAHKKNHHKQRHTKKNHD